ncbi:hypothetical protein [Nonomuraea sp. NPDC049695]|uniref:hypothetical protein n=1 Tax=Nonomuraea sp. NPDC049695 TaxID=3154734 RepID=UPI00341C0A73
MTGPVLLASAALLAIAALAIAIICVRTRDRAAHINRLELERHQAFVAYLHDLSVQQLSEHPSMRVVEMELRNFRARTYPPPNF